MGQRKPRFTRWKLKPGGFVLEHNTVKLFQQVVTQAQDVVDFCCSKPSSLHAICLVDYDPFRSYTLGIRILYCAHGNTLALKQSVFLPCFASESGKSASCSLRSRHTSMGLSKTLSHGEERKAPRFSELLRQPQERELSVTGVMTALGVSSAPGARQSAFGHPTSKRGHETQSLPGHVALTKEELYPMGSAEAPKKEKNHL